MTPINEAEAIRRFPVLEGLRTIRCAGWKFKPLLDESGALVGIDGWRYWPGGWRDAIGVESQTDATGIRVCGEDIVWDFSGTLADVIAELLVLPAPGERSAPRLVIGAAPVLWPP